MRLPTAPMPLSDSQREVLAKLSRSRAAAHRQVQRARVLLRAADGAPSTRIAADVGVSATTVKNWRGRFEQVKAGQGQLPMIQWVPAATVRPTEPPTGT